MVFLYPCSFLKENGGGVDGGGGKKGGGQEGLGEEEGGKLQ